ncbi:YheC/YheD family protein [Brevibacillus porteri]|uniref:Endospore coat-associated protein n=1 Tax=Brevibacillus porteri TaxID=2126350 RepID=A0ABX5FY55_9BACL|nr:YheC/YheD family protein [Brevibacillus porteri]MED1797661.1 YheC/YheD family protein [Brevibacillus porteri]MED2130599.1 YheC/YheD family protein [Brevibacillus porteri]MED2746229.1 YheC/YheD family protein [Brevibacillus porteri]MED2818023.1 YheC/YheD family protein [Brevibacillus porteri]MED2895188.1 YheC/YheD family protein [Brevibacillus porteri]
METFRMRLRFLSNPRIIGIILPATLFQQLQLRQRQKIKVLLGKKEVVATVLQDKRNPDTNVMKVTTLLQTELGIPHPGLIQLKLEGSALRIGPSIGIVTTGIRRDPKQPIGPRTSFFHNLLQAQEGKGVFYYIFSPSDVDWESNTVKAWFLRRSKSGGYFWKKHVTAMPDVVYDRIPSRSAEKHEAVQEFKYRLASYPNLPMFNQGFFNKWGVHQLLYPNPEVNEHIPETYTSPSLTTVRNLLRKYPIVYLKPKNGSLGYGIVKVVRQAGGGFTASYHTGSGNVKKQFSKLSSLYQHVFRSRRVSSYLAQQGISLMTFHGRPFDFRVHLHKNQQNEWVVSCTAAKVAGSGSVTTHVRTGGTVIPGDDLLQHLFGRQKALMTQRVSDASIRLATAIELAKGIDLGELGLDMGIDTQGHVWMFEANSKPGRSIFKHARLREADHESRKLLVDYSCYLANF